MKIKTEADAQATMRGIELYEKQHGISEFRKLADIIADREYGAYGVVEIKEDIKKALDFVWPLPKNNRRFTK